MCGDDGGGGKIKCDFKGFSLKCFLNLLQLYSQLAYCAHHHSHIVNEQVLPFQNEEKETFTIYFPLPFYTSDNIERETN